MTNELRYRALPKQLDFIRSDASEVLYSGAFRAGKSRALCMKLVYRASRPGARELLCRKTLKSLKGSTLVSLLEPEGTDLPPVLPQGTYTHNKQEGTIRIHGGGTIQYFGIMDAGQVGSYFGTGVAIDEAVDLSEDDFVYLRGRKSVEVEGLPRQMYMACNPGPPTHPLAIQFGLRPGATIEEGCEVIQTTTFDNTFLPKSYHRELSRYKGLYKERYVLGKWVGGEGVIYDRFFEPTHVKEIPGSDEWRTVIAIDDGYSNPFCALRLRIDSDDRVHVDREFYKSGLLVQSKIQAVKAMGGAEAEVVLVDPSASQLIAELTEAGIPVYAAKNDVFQGILAVQERLHEQTDGLPRLTMSPSCENLRREFGAYSWRQNKDGAFQDAPIKDHDHAPDALRYGIMYVDGSSGPLFY